MTARALRVVFSFLSLSFFASSTNAAEWQRAVLRHDLFKRLMILDAFHMFTTQYAELNTEYPFHLPLDKRAWTSEDRKAQAGAKVIAQRRSQRWHKFEEAVALAYPSPEFRKTYQAFLNHYLSSARPGEPAFLLRRHEPFAFAYFCGQKVPTASFALVVAARIAESRLPAIAHFTSTLVDTTQRYLLSHSLPGTKASADSVGLYSAIEGLLALEKASFPSPYYRLLLADILLRSHMVLPLSDEERQEQVSRFLEKHGSELFAEHNASLVLNELAYRSTLLLGPGSMAWAVGRLKVEYRKWVKMDLQASCKSR